MNRLYLLRHGIAVPHGTTGIEDDDRELTPAGERRLRMVAQGLRRLKVTPDKILTSPLPRAHRTAEIVAGVLGLEDLIEVADELRAGRSAASIRDWLHGRPEGEARPMLVGHDPAFSELIGLLITGEPVAPICELHKGGVAAFASAADGSLRLDWLLRPRTIRRLSK